MTLTSAGLTKLANLASSIWTHMGIGTGTATVNLSDVDLQSEVSPRRLDTVTASGRTAYFTRKFGPTENNSASNITEVGMFNAESGNIMLFRTTASTATFSAFISTSSQAKTVSTNLTFTV